MKDDLDGRALALLFRGHGALTAVVCFIMAFTVFLVALPHVYSSSPDLAHHYALIRWLMEHASIDQHAPAVLGEMAIYPRYAHVVAAALGAILNSPFLGMQAVAACSLAVCWAAIALASRLFPARESWIFTLSMLALLALNRHTVRLDLFGHELVINYFFSQIAGQACFMAIVLGAARIEKAQNATTSAIIPIAVIATSLVCAGIHLLPAIEGIAYGLLLLAVHAVTRPRKLAGFALLAVVALAAATLLLRHPAYVAMRAISNNDGYLPLSALTSTGRVLGLAIFTGLVSLTLIVRSIPGHRLYSERAAAAARHLGAAGAAIAGLCILQAIAAAFGMGSNYACRKYAFGLSTFAIINIATLIALVVPGHAGQRSNPGKAILPWIQPPLILSALWFFTYARTYVDLDSTTFIPIERTATLARDIGYLDGDGQPFARGIYLGNVSSTVNYLVSQAIFHAPRDGNGMAPLFDRPFPDPHAVGAILSSTQSPSVWSTPDCIRHRLGNGFVVADGDCILSRFTDKCVNDMDMSNKGFVPPDMLTGFSGPEGSGRWTDGPKATVTCHVKGAALPTHVTIDMTPFNPNGHQQSVDVSVNDGPAQRHDLASGATIDAPVRGPGKAPGTIVVTLSLPNAISPRDAGVGPDKRQLGVRISRISFNP